MVSVIALLHGGMHDGSCWDSVASELSARGHRVVAPDLPVDDDRAGAMQWAGVAIEAIDKAAGAHERDVLVVGHSIAGLCVPVIAALRPVRGMVFVAGLIPVIGQSFAEHLSHHPGAVTFPAPRSTGDGPFGLDFATVRHGFYHDVEESVARAAFSRLRGQAMTIMIEPCPIALWPAVPSSFIVMNDDRAVDPVWARSMALAAPCSRVIDMAGSHSPFYARPRHLAGVLAAIAAAEPSA